jgi:hypothetical protein
MALWNRDNSAINQQWNFLHSVTPVISGVQAFHPPVHELTLQTVHFGMLFSAT